MIPSSLSVLSENSEIPIVEQCKSKFRQRVRDLNDISLLSEKVDLSHLGFDEWYDIASMSELLNRKEIQRLILCESDMPLYRAVELYNAFGVYCGVVCADEKLEEIVKEFYEVVLRFYSNNEPLAVIRASFIIALEPLFDFLYDVLRETPIDYLVVSQMQNRWNNGITLAFAKHLVMDRLELLAGD